MADKTPSELLRAFSDACQGEDLTAVMPALVSMWCACWNAAITADTEAGTPVNVEFMIATASDMVEHLHMALKMGAMLVPPVQPSPPPGVPMMTEAPADAPVEPEELAAPTAVPVKYLH